LRFKILALFYKISIVCALRLHEKEKKDNTLAVVALRIFEKKLSGKANEVRNATVLEKSNASLSRKTFVMFYPKILKPTYINFI
jgi:hypothetical protein